MMKKTEYREIIQVLVLLICLVGFFLVQVYREGNDQEEKDRIIFLEKDWKVTELDGSSSWQDMPVILQRRGTTERMEQRMPEQIEEGDFLCYFTNNEIMDVYIGKKPAEVSVRIQSQMAKPGNGGWVLIPLTQEDSGKTLSLQMKNGQEKEPSQIGKFMVGKRMAIDRELFREWLPRLIRNLVLGFVGIFWIVDGIWIQRMKKETVTSVCAGLFAMALSVWLTFGTVEIPYIYMIHSSVTTYLVLCCILLMPLFLARYMRERQASRNTGWDKWFGGLEAALAANAVIITGICAFREEKSVKIYLSLHILMEVMAVSVVANTVWCMRREPASIGRGELLARILLGLSLCIEIFNFYRGDSLQMGNYFSLGAMVFTVSVGIQMRKSAEEQRRAERRTKLELQRTKEKLLLSQIRPHFIYNTLGAIRYMIRRDPETAYQMTYQFSRYLRGNLQALEGEEMIPFSRELDHIRTYISIEQVRFGEALNMVCEIQEEGFRIPVLTIQPLVENAVKHGIRQKEGGGCVILRTGLDGNRIFIEIEDNGAGFDVKSRTESDQMDHLGLRNVMYRLESLLGAEVSIASQIGEGTRIYISFEKDRGRDTYEDNHCG